jgi:hypothetical protein
MTGSGFADAQKAATGGQMRGELTNQLANMDIQSELMANDNKKTAMGVSAGLAGDYGNINVGFANQANENNRNLMDWEKFQHDKGMDFEELDMYKKQWAKYDEDVGDLYGKLGKTKKKPSSPFGISYAGSSQHASPSNGSNSSVLGARKGAGVGSVWG